MKSVSAKSIKTLSGAALAAALCLAAGGAGAVPYPQLNQPVEVPLDPGLAPYHPGPPVAGSAAGITGMDSVEVMFRAWAKAFRVYNPNAELTITQKDVAPEERIALGPDTAEVFHPENGAYEDKYGYEPFRIRICQGGYILKSHVSATAVLVNKANPIGQIALDKLDAIFSDARRRGYPADITTWGQLGLGGPWADKPIHPYGFYWRDDVTWYFKDTVDRGAPFKPSYRIAGPEDMKRRTPAVAADVMQALADDPYGISFANFSYMSPNVKPLALEDEHGVVGQPVLADIASGRYPLQRFLYIYVNRKPGQPLDPMIKAFLSFVLSADGQALVAKDHYLPLTAAMAAAERAKLN